MNPPKLLIRSDGPPPEALLHPNRRGILEFATLEWVWWFNHHRLLEPLGYLPRVN